MPYFLNYITCSYDYVYKPTLTYQHRVREKMAELSSSGYLKHSTSDIIPRPTPNNRSEHITIIVRKINETNGKYGVKVAVVRYTERVNFRLQSRKAASKQTPDRGLDTRFAFLVIMVTGHIRLMVYKTCFTLLMA